jgi:hypothetical protein
MDLDRELVAYLEETTADLELPSGIRPRVLRRARARRAMVAVLATLAIVGVSFSGIAAIRAIEPWRSDRFIPSSSRQIAVPNVVGLSEGEAEKVLSAAGLMAEFRYSSEGPPLGEVVRTVPEAGEAVSGNSIVNVIIASEAFPEETGPDAGLIPQADLVGAHPEAFVGVYLDDAETPVVVFNPDVDKESWKVRLDVAAKGRKYRTERCPYTLVELQLVKSDMMMQDAWTDRNISYGFDVDPATCSVGLMTEALTPAELRALKERYGPLVTVDTIEGGFED